jgi:ABC-type transport system substrate-binding protein
VIGLHAARPHYGGTLRIETQGVIRTLDPAAAAADAAEASMQARILPLVFETLVAVNPSGGLGPLLAVGWERDAAGQRWRFRVRESVRLHDGSVLQPAQVAAALRTPDRGWKIGVDGAVVVIDLNRPQPDLPWELAGARSAVVIRTAAGDRIGSGPFRVESMEPRRIALRAHEDYWAGRPFVDAVQIAEGRTPGDQLTSLESGRADLIDVRPIDLRRLVQRGFRSASSRPVDLVALVFEPHRATPADDLVRRTVAKAIDRATLSTVLLQRQAEPAAALLPSWLSGYAPMFEQVPPPSWRGAVAALPADKRRLTLRVDATDAVAQAIAERMAVDVREAGIIVDVQAPAGLAPRPDARLVRLALDATTPDRVLAGIMNTLGSRTATLATTEPAPGAGAPLDAVYRVERALLDRDIIVPVVHLPALVGLGERVESWSGPAVSPSGRWNAASLWLRGDTSPGRPGQPGQQ